MTDNALPYEKFCKLRDEVPKLFSDCKSVSDADAILKKLVEVCDLLVSIKGMSYSQRDVVVDNAENYHAMVVGEFARGGDV